VQAKETGAMNFENVADDFVLTERLARTPQETLEDRWFAERPSRSSLFPQRRSTLPPMGDDEVDLWVR
jgi:hypothetical protein